MSRHTSLIYFICNISAIILFNACSHHSDLQTFNNNYYGGHDKKAYEYAKSKAGKSGDVLWNLQAGVSAFGLGDEESMDILEQGETLFSKYEQEGLLGGAFGNVGAVLVNENVKTYRGNIYEGVMFNYYKALNAMAHGNYANARVEFNRANDRQRRAKDYFRKDIQKAMEEESKQNAQDSTLNQIDTRASQGSIAPILEREYSNLRNFAAYDGFINPAVSYVSALFFLTEEDYAKAIDLYKESYGITRSASIDDDLRLLQQRRNGRFVPHTWFIIEDGRSAWKNDMSINMPSYYVSGSALHVGVSIPTLNEGKIAMNNYQARNHNGVISRAAEISDIDGVIANEFQKQLPFILTRAIASSIVKASTQAVLADQLGTAGALAGMLYSLGTTSADVRISTALPKRVLAMQIPNHSGDFILQADSHVLYYVSFKCNENSTLNENKAKKTQNTIILCAKNDNIVYLRVKGGNLTYRILKGVQNENE